MKHSYNIHLSKLMGFFSTFKISVVSLQTFLLSLTAFSLPIGYRFTTFCLIAFASITLFNSKQLQVSFKSKKWFAVLPWFSYYVWFAVGFIYSTDQNTSFKDLETKFSLLALPLLIGMYTKINTQKLTFIFSSFIIGLVGTEIISLLFAYSKFIDQGQINAFFYHNLVNLSDINAAYFSWYVNFSLVLLIFHPFHYKRSWIVITVIFQILFLFLLASRASQMVFVFFIVPFAFYYYRKFYQRKLYYLFAFVYVITIISGAFSPSLFNKRLGNFAISQAEQAFLPHFNHYSYEFNNISTKLFFWRVGIENISSSNLILGVGNGDVNDVQNQKMHQLGIKDIYSEKNPSDFLNMNLHNMYLQSLLAAGIIGLILLLSILLQPLIIGLKKKDVPLILFQLLSIIFMLHESALQTQAGVVFYCYFAFLLVNHLHLEPSKGNIYHLTKNQGAPNTLKNKTDIRLFDVLASLVILIPFIFLILPICALLIKIESTGPIFFIQKRTGKNNRIFLCYKLRTMKLNDKADWQQAIQQDERITKFGYFLRLMHIDELPQLYNVLKGDMSIIGPRPHMLYHSKIYSQQVPYYNLRLQAKPGLTGLAQIKGFVGEIRHQSDLKKRVLSDIYYVRRSSFKLNLYILGMTLKNLVGKVLEINHKAL